MSGPEYEIVLSPRAQSDVRNILRYTGRTWGARQQAKYRSELDRALSTIFDNPRIGSPREDLRPGLRTFPMEYHVIYYRIEPQVIRVERILHGSMDVTSEFG